MRWVRDGEGRKFLTRGDEVIDWIEANCVLTDSVWIGQPFRLLGWQKRVILELFECDTKRRLRYRMALIGVARKQGKSELAAAIGLYLAFGAGDESAAVYCAAASEDQADVVFEKARRMVELSDLHELIDVPQGTRVSQPRLSLRENPYQFLMRLSAKGKTKHGLNPSAVILDELHVWGVGEGEELYEALTTAMAARPNGLILAVTTAGANLEESRCGALYQLGERMRAGEVDDPTFYYRWWQAPDGCRLDDPEAWRAASPSLNGIVDEDFYRGELVRVPEAHFRRLYLNQWVDYGETPWVVREQIQPCRVPEFELRPGQAAWVGVDLAESRDATAVVVAQWWDGERPCGHTDEPCLYVRARAWSRPTVAAGRLADDWEIPQAEVKQYIRDLNASYAVATNVFDPWHSKLMRQDLANEGLTVEEIWQTGARRSGASAALYDLIIQERIHYCDDVFERHCLNATIRETGTDGGYYLAKRRKGAQMDVAMAAVNVVYGTMFAPVVERAASAFWA